MENEIIQSYINQLATVNHTLTVTQIELDKVKAENEQLRNPAE